MINSTFSCAQSNAHTNHVASKMTCNSILMCFLFLRFTYHANQRGPNIPVNWNRSYPKINSLISLDFIYLFDKLSPWFGSKESLQLFSLFIFLCLCSFFIGFAVCGNILRTIFQRKSLSKIASQKIPIFVLWVIKHNFSYVFQHGMEL